MRSIIGVRQARNPNVVSPETSGRMGCADGAVSKNEADLCGPDSIQPSDSGLERSPPPHNAEGGRSFGRSPLSDFGPSPPMSPLN